jgi:hypothetical protein
MAGLLRQGTVLGRYDTQAQQWNRRLEERSPMSGQEQQEIPMSKRAATEDAEDAGAAYASDQIGGTYFTDWVRAQLIEASRMDPEKVLPLETKADALVVARNMLKQLEWDTKRDLNESRDFFKGFSERLHDPSVRDWLADELLEINRGLRGGGGVEEARRGAPSTKPWFGQGEGSWIYGIKIDGIDNSFPLKPLGRQEEWHAVRAFQAAARTDWIRAKHASSGTAALKRWGAAVKPAQFYAKWGEGDDSFQVWYAPSADGDRRVGGAG